MPRADSNPIYLLKKVLEQFLQHLAVLLPAKKGHQPNRVVAHA
ncbi:hypothetical protein [Ktedonosporobacter rubrisoli]|nr:hypothetical protein [Ktedonosporobacter rubrisoli]